VTATSLQTWSDCPRRYRFRYVDRPKPTETGGPWAHLALGNSVHAALADWMALPSTERTWAALSHYLQARWDPKGYETPEQAEAWHEVAAGWLAAYGRDASSVDVTGIERRVQWPVPADVFGRPFVIEGRVDRIDRVDGRLLVVDYKAGRSAPDDADGGGSWALAIYVYAVMNTLSRRSGEWCTRAELHHLPTGVVVTVDYDRARIERQMRRIHDEAWRVADTLAIYGDTRDGLPADAPGDDLADLQDDLFPAKPGALCAACPFRHLCPEGQAARPAATPWAYLPDLPATAA
jgi:RecB family exonuclease